VSFAGFRFRHREQVIERLRGRRGGHDDHQRRVTDPRDGQEIALTVELELREKRHVSGDPIGGHQQRVAIRRSLGRRSIELLLQLGRDRLGPEMPILG
jgi:ABC-type polar amino acid transport system ATPase subunit